MGSNLSREQNSDETNSNRERNLRTRDREASDRPTKRIRTGTTSSENNNEGAIMSRSSEDDLETLQNDVEHVEQILNQRRGILFSNANGDRSVARALFDSIGGAIGSIRNRLQTLGSSDAATEEGQSSSTESLRALSQRLDTVERSHSTRIPLNLLQNELSRRDLSLEGAAASVHSEDRMPESPSSVGTRRSQLRRQSSALLASRHREDSVRSIAESPMSSVSLRNFSENSFASSRDLAASIRTQSATLPSLNETKEEDMGVEVVLTPHGDEIKSDKVLLVPDSARKQRPSLRGSMKILGDDVVRELSKIDAEENEIATSPQKQDLASWKSKRDRWKESPRSRLKPLPSSTKTSTDSDGDVDLPAVGLYTWGSFEFSSGEISGEDRNKEGMTYRLFDSSETAKGINYPRLLPRDTRLGRADIVAMSASETHCAFVTSSGRLLTCGNNSEGAVDPSQRDALTIPRPMHLEAGLTITRIKKVSCGINHTAVVTENKSVLTWGVNGKGQLGHRNARRSGTANFVFPKAFILGSGGRRADNVVCCDGYTLVLTTRMEAFVCGGESCEPPDATSKNEENSYFPLPQQNAVLCGLPLVGIAAGLRHLVVWTAHGTAYAWGCNESGQCGREYPRELKTPVPIGVPKSSLTPYPVDDKDSSISFSPLLKNWNVWASGEPISLASDVHIVDAACGRDHTILVTESGRLLVCGSNKSGQLGLISNSHQSLITSKIEPVEHPNGQKFQSAQAGARHTVILDENGIVWQMGNGDSTMRHIPPFFLSSIVAGGSINFAITKRKNEEASSSRIPPVPELDVLMNTIRLEQEEAKKSNGIEDVARGAENLFRSPSVMNTLFVDPNEIDHMYETLINGSHTEEMKQRIVSSIERGMFAGLKSMEDSRMIYFESVRFLLLYLQCPLWRKKETDTSEKDSTESTVRFDSRGDLLFLLCETILGLPFEGYKAFLAWSASVYGKELFVPLLVKPLIQQLNYRFVNNITHGIPMIAGVLRWLHTVNERSDNALARGQDFYCSGIDDMPMEALFQDLTSYQMASNAKRSSNFFLAAHPFLMSPSIKQKLLQVEHQMSMIEAAQADGVSFDATTRQFKFQPYFVLAIDRKHLLPQTLQAVAKASTGELRKGLRVVFKGEDGVDAGGVTKEFFQLLCEQLFDVNTGMWTTDFGNHNETWFNSDCTWNGEGYYLVGVLCGLAVYNSVILDVHFPHAIYRKLLGLPLGLEDVIDEDTRKGLKSLLDYDGGDAEDVFCLNFEVSWIDLGQERKKELKPGGSNIAVTSENKEEYVMLYVKWLLVDSIASQYDEFERGFNQVMEDSSLHIFLAEELELLVSGTPELDFFALERSTNYEGGFDKDSAVVRNIWKWIQSASLPVQEKFLKFCTGSSKGPIGGLGKMPFKIQRAGPDSQQLPTAHTCFNTLIVPDYGDDYEKLSHRLGRAIIECEGFGLQ